MAEYIKRRDALKVLEEMESAEDGFSRMYNILAADVVEVVRCGECENYSAQCEGYGYCYYWDYEPGDAPNSVYSNEFCSHGKRRDG